MQTSFLKPTQIQRKNFLVDADGKILGRLAQAVAKVLRGKDTPSFTPHLDCGSRVVVINAGKVVVTGNKRKQKVFTRYSGYPGGLKKITLGEMLQNKPEEALRHAVKGMLPHTPLGRKIFRKLRVYRGSEVPPSIQKEFQTLSL